MVLSVLKPFANCVSSLHVLLGTYIYIYIYIYIYRTRTVAPKLSATSSVAHDPLVEHWSRDPEGAGSIPSRRPWSCIFRNWSRFGLKMYIFLTLEFTYIL